MKYVRIDDYDMAYIDLGHGRPLVCVHGTLGDYRTWSPLFGPLSRRHRVIAVSLRHFFPQHGPEDWPEDSNGVGGSYTIAQHVADLIAFIADLKLGPVDLLGHSRGGHIAFRVAQERPDLLRKLILAEPGGAPDASLLPAGHRASNAQRSYVAAAAALIAAGDIDGGLALAIDAIDGSGAWRQRPPAARLMLRDNAHTLIGQINEQRQPYTRADTDAIRLPTLFVAGQQTMGPLAEVWRILAEAVHGSCSTIVPGARHWMMDDNPEGTAAAILEFTTA